MKKRKCACGRYYVAQEWKTEKEKSMCFTCFVRKKLAKDLLKDLTPREQKIIDTRFGISDGVARTLDETGKIFGLTRERIRQIEAKALTKMELAKRAKLKKAKVEVNKKLK